MLQSGLMEKLSSELHNYLLSVYHNIFKVFFVCMGVCVRSHISWHLNTFLITMVLLSIYYDQTRENIINAILHMSQ